MAPRRKPGGVGAVGSGIARFFHPSQRIREKWPNEHQKLRVRGVVITGKGDHRINRKVQRAYECRIPDIDDSTVFNIVCGNFKVEQAPIHPFEDERVTTNATPASRQAEDPNRALRASIQNAVNNIGVGGATRENIQLLREQGVEVDDEDCLPENEAAPDAPPAPA